MKRIYTLISALLFCVSVMQGAEKIDSLSYSAGHHYTLAFSGDRNEIMRSHKDFEEYIRGLEENFRPVTVEDNDSSYMMSYMLGAMEGTIISDALLHKEKEEMPPVRCILAGLLRVANGEIALPADTIAAMSTINRFIKDDKNPADLDEETQCQFFTAYGIMKAYQPGLQEYITGLLPGTACVENRQAYAAGIADLLLLSTEKPETAYDLGKHAALGIILGHVEDMHLDFASFVEGARAALGLREEIISKEEMERILTRENHQNNDEKDVRNENYDTIGEYLSQLKVKLFTKYRVDWNVTATPVAKSYSQAAEIFNDVMAKLNIRDGHIVGFLMVQPRDEDEKIYNEALSIIGNTTLPDGLKWFCGRKEGLETTIGIMDTTSSFNAKVDEASVDLNYSGMLNVPWTFNTDNSLKWADFTSANVGNFIAVEINRVFIFAPKVNSPITGGGCSLSAISPEEVNRLFKDAREIPAQIGE